MKSSEIRKIVPAGDARQRMHCHKCLHSNKICNYLDEGVSTLALQRNQGGGERGFDVCRTIHAQNKKPPKLGGQNRFHGAPDL
jgi:hypothetical protein